MEAQENRTNKAKDCGLPKNISKTNVFYWRTIYFVVICTLLILTELIFRLFDKRLLEKIILEESSIIEFLYNKTLTNE